MKSNQLSLRQTLIATGAIGAFLGLFLRDPGNASWSGLLFLAFWCVGKAWFFKLSFRIRLAVEISTLILLLYISSKVWTPRFYTDEASRCDDLACNAREPICNKPKLRNALDREAEWFSRRASELRWKGWWLGLTLGPFTRNDQFADLAYEFGTLESIERHEKRVKQWIVEP